MPHLVPESRAGSSSRVDLAGTAPLTAGLTAIVLPLVAGRAHGWPLSTWPALGAAPAILAAFAAHRRRLGRRGDAPLLDPALFRDRAFTTGLQLGRGLDALQALTSTVLTSLEPRRAGAAAGLLSTMQQVGNAIGVAVTGVVFFGALDRGYATASCAASSSRRAAGRRLPALRGCCPEGGGDVSSVTGTA